MESNTLITPYLVMREVSRLLGDKKSVRVSTDYNDKKDWFSVRVGDVEFTLPGGVAMTLSLDDYSDRHIRPALIKLHFQPVA